MSNLRPQPSPRNAAAMAISPTTHNGTIGDPLPANNREIEDGLDRINMNQITSPTVDNGEHHHRHHFHIGDLESIPRTKAFWAKFNGVGKQHVPGWAESAHNTLCHSWFNFFILFIPFSWAAHWAHWHYSITFALSFLAVMPLVTLSEFGGEQMALYLGTSLGDLLIITFDNIIEATSAIILLTRCELKLAQSTFIGVILLHLLFVPGTAFLTGGAEIWEQHLRPRPTQLNHSLLIFGVMTLLLPVALFSALPASLPSNGSGGSTAATAARLMARADGEEGLAIKEAMVRAAGAIAVTDSTRGTFLKFSRGLSIILLIAYIGSRIYLHNPPGKSNFTDSLPDAIESEKRREAEIEWEQPRIGPWFGILLLTVVVALIVVTTEWLISSVEQVRDQGTISSEWFGLILLPLLGFSADALIATIYFVKKWLYLHPDSPEELAKARSIDLSIQLTLFWVPLIVVLGWWTHRPMSLLFDLWEVAILIGACFLVNYATAEPKTHWIEGMLMILFYVGIALVAWFYDGQPEVHEMLRCESIDDSLAVVANGISGARAK